MPDSIYNHAIIAEAKSKVGAGELPAPDARVRRDNPLCGDRVILDVLLEDGHVASVAHKTRGCLLAQAAASILARHAVGADVDEARKVKAEVEALLAGGNGTPSWPELAMFAPVHAVRSRHECVLLPFEALEEALTGTSGKS
jgi:nitrogen fixation NifU-like protein